MHNPPPSLLTRDKTTWILAIVAALIWGCICGPTNAPIFGFVASTIILGLTVWYLTVARRAVRGNLFRVRSRVLRTIAQVFLIFGVGILVTVPQIVGWCIATRRISSLLVEAQAARDAGKLEEAIKLLEEAVEFRNSYHLSTRKDLVYAYNQFGRELGRRQEPEVLGLIERANTAMASGDKATAISLLHRATDPEFNHAPSSPQASDRLMELEHPEYFAQTNRRATDFDLSTFDQVKIGMRLADVEAMLGAGELVSSSETKRMFSTTSVKLYSWSGRGLKSIAISFVDDKVVSKTQIGL